MLSLLHWHFSNRARFFWVKTWLPSSTKNSHLLLIIPAQLFAQLYPAVHGINVVRFVHGVVPVITHIFYQPTIKKIYYNFIQPNQTHGWTQHMSISVEPINTLVTPPSECRALCCCLLF